MERAIAAGNIGSSRGDHWRCQNRTPRHIKFPQLFPVQAQASQLFVISAKDDGIAREISSGGHLAAGIICPEFLASICINAMEYPIRVADKNFAVVKTGPTLHGTRFICPL